MMNFSKNLKVTFTSIAILGLAVPSFSHGHESLKTLAQLRKATILARVSTASRATVASKLTQNVLRTTIPAVPTCTKVRPLPWKPSTKIEDLLKREKNITRALGQVWQYQDRYGNHNLFKTFAQTYYNQHFTLVTPHLSNLFKAVAKVNDRTLEERFIKRMAFLIANKRSILDEINPNIEEDNIRIRYLANVGTLTAQNFREDQLVLSIEKRMSPYYKEDFAIRHINGKSKFPVGQNSYKIYDYKGPLEFLPNLYLYLINGNDSKVPFTIIFDEVGKSLTFLNQTKTLWIRITSHEYSDPTNLHIHLNELRRVPATNAYGIEVLEKVNINLSIPFHLPKELPEEDQTEFLYKKMVEIPVKHFMGNDHVTILRKSIF